ncbi:MAG TPA: transketolase C-terminal domain-containing protein, partial [Solirubrobacterales bacterium]|nr:transketolase C-terminal domain-containing protein [Solirubrobacterales bacterium]
VDRPNLEEIAVENRLRPDAVTSNGSANGSAEGESDHYLRYKLAESGISPMAVPGAAGAYVSTGIEHDEHGHPGYTPELHIAMQNKRWNKLKPLAASSRVTVTGPEQADVGILGWGSTEGAAMEAAEILRERGLSAATFYPRILSPLPVERIKAWAAGMGTIVVPEVNFTGQFARIVRADCELPVISQTQITGLPFTAKDIADFIQQNVAVATAPTV